MNGICWGTFTGRELTGYLIAVDSGSCYHLVNLAVDPAHRHKGIARTMLRKLLRTALDNGKRSVQLEVRRSNRSAIKLYRSEGFVEVDVKPRYYEDNEDALVFSVSI